MARAGFYAVESGKISFRHDGHWYNDEDRIENSRIALLFSRSIRRNRDGSYFLQVADERAPIMVEDTPYVVIGIDDDGVGGFVIVTNDEVREPLDPSTLEVGEANVLYCSVKQGGFPARFLRNAYYRLAEHFRTDDGENFSILISDHYYPIRTGRATGANSSATSKSHSQDLN
jgi:hypothetical protein